MGGEGAPALTDREGMAGRGVVAGKEGVAGEAADRGVADNNGGGGR